MDSENYCRDFSSKFPFCLKFEAFNAVENNSYQQARQEAADSQSLNHLSAQLRSVLDFSRLPSLEEALSPSGNIFNSVAILVGVICHVG